MHVKNPLNFRGSPLSPTHPDLEVLENPNLRGIMGMAADYRDSPPRMIPSDTRDRSPRREIGKMG
jgi:hypothetical protein